MKRSNSFNPPPHFQRSLTLDRPRNPRKSWPDFSIRHRSQTFPFADFTPRKENFPTFQPAASVPWKKYVTGRERELNGDIPESCRKPVKCKTSIDGNGFEEGFEIIIIVEWNEKNDVDHFFF